MWQEAAEYRQELKQEELARQQDVWQGEAAKSQRMAEASQDERSVC